MCVKCARNITHVPEMCPVETCQANGSSPFNVPDMFLPVSRCLRPQCEFLRIRAKMHDVVEQSQPDV